MKGHPFEKLFLKALHESTKLDNRVTFEALNLVKRGYQIEEVAQALSHLRRTIIDDEELEIVSEAYDELSRSLPE